MSLLDVNSAKGKVLDYIAEGRTIKDACKAAGVGESTHYLWLRNDKAYDSAYKYALSIRNGRLIQLAEDRVINGIEEVTITYEMNEYGEEVQTGRIVKRRFDTALHNTMLKAYSPEIFDPKNKPVDENKEDETMKILNAARKRLAAMRE